MGKQLEYEVVDMTTTDVDEIEKIETANDRDNRMKRMLDLIVVKQRSTLYTHQKRRVKQNHPPSHLAPLQLVNGDVIRLYKCANG